MPDEKKWELSVGGKAEGYDTEDDLLERVQMLLIDVLRASAIADLEIHAPDGSRMDLSLDVSLEAGE